MELLDILGLPFILFVVGALAGFVDSIVGGGGLISVPAMLLTNMPPSMALGSNKLSSVFGAGSAMVNFSRSGNVNWKLMKKALPFTLIGSVIGTITVINIPPLYLKPLIIALLIGVLMIVVFKKDWAGREKPLNKGIIAAYMVGALGLGFYDGFIGPGTGMFLIFMFLFGGFDFLRASGNAKVLNTASNIGSLAVFIYLGHVNYVYGLSAGAGQVIGAFLGSRLAIKKGSGLVRIVFITMTTSMLAKLMYDYATSQGLL